MRIQSSCTYRLILLQYEYPITDAYLKDLESKKVVITEPEQEEPEWTGKDGAAANGTANGAPSTEASSTEATVSIAAAADAPTSPSVEASTTEAPATTAPTAPTSDALITQRTGAATQTDEPMAVDVPFRAEEKKRLHWEGKTCM